MTRKRFCKLIMAQGIQRNTAAEMAKEVEQAGSYERLYFWFIVRKRKWPYQFAWANTPATYAAADLAAQLGKRRHNDSLDAMLYAVKGFQQIMDPQLLLALDAWEGLKKALLSICEWLREAIIQATESIIENVTKSPGDIFKGGA